MTTAGTARLAGVVEMTPRGPMLLEPDGMRWRLTGDVALSHLIGSPVTVEGTISGAAIAAYYLAPRTETPPC